MKRILTIGILIWACFTGLSSYVWVCKVKKLCNKCSDCKDTKNKINFDDTYNGLGIGNLSISDGENEVFSFNGNFVTDKNLDTVKYPSFVKESFTGLNSFLSRMDEKNSITLISNYDAAKENASIGMSRLNFMKNLLSKYNVDISKLKFETKATDGLYKFTETNVACLDFMLDEVEVLANENADALSEKDLMNKFLSQKILFEYSNDNYIDNYDSFFDELSDFLKKYKRKVTITGHTDNKSSSSLNQRLGMKRAQKTKTELVNRGVPSNLVKIISNGERNPISSNASENGRQQNRRISLKF